MPHHVSVRNLRKKYGRHEAVRGVSFDVEHGEIFGLLGPNGAGKTTTVECILGLRRPDGGDIHVGGIDALRQPDEMQQRVGAALQTTALQEHITPHEALRLFGSFYRQHASPDELLARFGIEDQAHARFNTLSGGQRQRLALALAFVNQPDLVFLDEPTTGLDPQSRRALHGDIRRMRADSRTVLLTTHYIEEAEQLCDRVAIIHQGRIVATGSPSDLIAASAAAPTVKLETSRPVPHDLIEPLLEQFAPVEAAQPPASAPPPRQQDGHATIRFRVRDVNRMLAALTAVLTGHDIEIRSLEVRKATLEDVFIELTGAPIDDHEAEADQPAASRVEPAPPSHDAQ